MPKKRVLHIGDAQSAATAMAMMMTMGGGFPHIAKPPQMFNMPEDEMKPDEPSKEEVAQRVQLAEERRQKKNAKRLANFKKSNKE